MIFGVNLSIMRIFDEKASKWYERIQSCLERYKQDEKGRTGSGKVTQFELIRRMEERYPEEGSGFRLTQASISRWFNFGGTGKWEAGIPPLKVVIMLADFFGVDVGYLLGETEYRTFRQEDAVEYLGLNEKAIEHIRLATRYETAFKNVHMLPDEAGEKISRLLASEGFFELVMSMEEMDRVYSGPDIQKRLFKELEEKYGPELLAEALEFDPYADEGQEVDPLLREAYIDTEAALSEMYSADMDKQAYVEAARYKLMKKFEEIVMELYPD